MSLNKDDVVKMTMAIRSAVKPQIDELTARVAALEVENRNLRLALRAARPTIARPTIARRTARL